LTYVLALNRSARFHCDEMLTRGFFAYTSNCTLVSDISALYPASCTGAAGCACVGGAATCSPNCTSAFQRMSLFGVSGTGTVQAASSNPSTAFSMWLYADNFGDTQCSFNFNNGFRWLILTSSGGLGAGVSGSYSTMDFGPGGASPRIASGSHYPRQAESVDLWANWYDATGPNRAVVNVDGVESTMVLTRGSAQNGAWKATVSGVGTGCHRYYFEFEDSTGATSTYPEAGSFGIGLSGCPDWDASRPGSSGAVPDGGAIAGVPLTLAKASGEQITLAWGPSCVTADTDYEVYEGVLGSFASHVSVLCSTGGSVDATISPGSDHRYYLVVPTTGGVEGSYGTTSAGTERPPSASACRPQDVAPCP
jgi:hypothetical protein